MRKHTPRDMALLQDEALTRIARTKLEPFIEMAWDILEPGTRFLSNWHIGLIAEHLEAVSAGQIQRLVINMPPRYGKSLITSVLWPVWEWISHPSRRWLFVSHSEALAHKHSLDRRLVLRHEWFRRRFPHIRLTRDQFAKAEFHNTKRGAMIATSMGGSVTGRGGDRLIIDDPHSTEQVESDLQRQHVTDCYQMTLCTRVDDKELGATVIVMQRLHTHDLSGVCLGFGFHHLCLPAVAPTRTTIIFPRSKRVLTREADELLWPAREDRTALAQLEVTLGSYGFAGQYQQQPVPRVGGLFPRGWWRYFHELPASDRRQYIQSWDLTFKDGDGNDYVVGLVGVRVGALLFLLDCYRGKAAFVDACRAIRDMKARYPETRAVLVEDAANGPAVIDTLRGEIEGVLAVNPQGGKQARAHAVQAQIEAGQVHLPALYTPSGDVRTDRLWVEDFVTECAAFPKGAHDDRVDALTQLLIWCRQHPHVEPASVLSDPEPIVKRFGLFHRDISALVHQPWSRENLEVRATNWIHGMTMGRDVVGSVEPDAELTDNSGDGPVISWRRPGRCYRLT